ncbi:hypothetical protein MRX96_016645 [Rhipicephalus microplus]
MEATAAGRQGTSARPRRRLRSAGVAGAHLHAWQLHTAAGRVLAPHQHHARVRSDIWLRHTGGALRPREMAAGLLVLCGILVAFLPTLLMTPDVGTSISGIVITLACALFQAMAFVILRRLSCQAITVKVPASQPGTVCTGREGNADWHTLYGYVAARYAAPREAVSLWTSVATVVLCVPPAGALGQLRHLDTEPLDLAYTAGAGLTALLTALLPTIACTLAEAGRVAIATTSSVVFSFALQAAVQLKAPTPWALVGAGFIVAAVVCSNLKWEPSVDIFEKLKLKGPVDKDKDPTLCRQRLRNSVGAVAQQIPPDAQTSF